MFSKFFKNRIKQATSADVREVLMLSTFGPALSFSMAFSSSRYSISSSVGLETVFSLFLARELLISEAIFFMSHVEREFKAVSLNYTTEIFPTGYSKAISLEGFLPYAQEMNLGRANMTSEAIKREVMRIINVVQQAFNEEIEIFRNHGKILNNIPLLREQDIPARLVDANGQPFIPAYVQVISDMGKMEGRHDWGDLDAVYLVAKEAVLRSVFIPRD